MTAIQPTTPQSVTGGTWRAMILIHKQAVFSGGWETEDEAVAATKGMIVVAEYFANLLEQNETKQVAPNPLEIGMKLADRAKTLLTQPSKPPEKPEPSQP